MVALGLLQEEEVGGCKIFIRKDMPSVRSGDNLRVGKQMDSSYIQVVG